MVPPDLGAGEGAGNKVRRWLLLPLKMTNKKISTANANATIVRNGSSGGVAQRRYKMVPSDPKGGGAAR